MNPTEVVSRFLDRWDVSIEEICAAFRESFRPDTVYDNVGSDLTTGPEESIALIERGAQASGFVRMGHDMLGICACGNRVYTERVDRFYDASGNEFHSLRVMGVFEVDPDGKISAWRDYFDPTSMTAFA